MEIRGIDFSGGRKPGDDIWIAEGRLEGGELRIDRCRSAADRFGETKRGAILRSLQETLGRSEGTTGIDASFGLPAELLPDGVETWTGATRWFADSFADAAATGMRERCTSLARSRPGEGVELKRRTDRTVGASSPYSFITYYQTLHAIRDVLAPLVDSGSIAVPPVRTGRPIPPDRDPSRTDSTNASIRRHINGPEVAEGDRPSPPPDDDGPYRSAGSRNVIEVYPAGTLRRLGTVDTGYKDGADGARDGRRRILNRLSSTDPGDTAGPDRVSLELPASVRETALEEPGGDALDSVVAAVATARAVEREFVTDRPFDDREGHIYV
ncbi:DUF429 domain-containing protein [Natronomonas sp. LN261]|uniref:DUF429 domain-containing protein n=1 Tax=Natronomonas sp. LN261 TaxID=2750669 RepID=UPI0015EF411C|nr:DUF429 domain-containing protein [Natronomonas sp. LN261]